MLMKKMSIYFYIGLLQFNTLIKINNVGESQPCIQYYSPPTINSIDIIHICLYYTAIWIYDYEIQIQMSIIKI